MRKTNMIGLDICKIGYNIIYNMDTSNIRLERVGNPDSYDLDCWDYVGARCSKRDIESWAGENERGENTNLVAITP
jgi:hypothetical protein